MENEEGIKNLPTRSVRPISFRLLVGNFSMSLSQVYFRMENINYGRDGEYKLPHSGARARTPADSPRRGSIIRSRNQSSRQNENLRNWQSFSDKSRHVVDSSHRGIFPKHRN